MILRRVQIVATPYTTWKCCSLRQTRRVCWGGRESVLCDRHWSRRSMILFSTILSAFAGIGWHTQYIHYEPARQIDRQQSHRHTYRSLSHQNTFAQSHSHTVTSDTFTQSHSHTVIQSHSRTVAQLHSHTATQSHSHTVTVCVTVWLLSIYLSIYLSIHPSIYLSIYLSIRQTVTVWLCDCVTVWSGCVIWLTAVSLSIYLPCNVYCVCQPMPAIDRQESHSHTVTDTDRQQSHRCLDG